MAKITTKVPRVGTARVRTPVDVTASAHKAVRVVGLEVQNLSPEAVTALRAFKVLSPVRRPWRFKGAKTAAIKKAVRSYYLG